MRLIESGPLAIIAPKLSALVVLGFFAPPKVTYDCLK